MLLIAFSCLCIASQQIFRSPSNHVALVNHRTVLIPPAGVIRSGLPECEPQWYTWVPWPHKDHSMSVHSTRESIMRFETRYLGNLGELEDSLGSGQVAELRVYSNKTDGSPVHLAVNDITIKASVAPVEIVLIKPNQQCLMVSNEASIFKLVGKDKYNRQFNTLHGGKVRWSFDEQIIQRIPMANSRYNSEHLFREQEDILVVKPKEEGKTSLTATLGCAGLSDKINLQVIRPIRFEPEVIWIAPGQTARVGLFKGVQRMAEGVPQVDIDSDLKVTNENSPEIKWETDGSDSAVLSVKTLSVKGIKKGTMTITASHSQFPLECNARLMVIVDPS